MNDRVEQLRQHHYELASRPEMPPCANCGRPHAEHEGMADDDYFPDEPGILALIEQDDADARFEAATRRWEEREGR